MEGTSDTHASCMCFPLLRPKPHAKQQHSAPAAPSPVDKPVAEVLPAVPAKVDIPESQAPAVADSAAKDLESTSTPQSDSIPAATSAASPSSSPPASRLPRSRQPTDEAATATEVNDGRAAVQSRKVSESDMITFTTTRIPSKSASAEETVTLVADATTTADIVIDITNSQPAPATPDALPPSKIPTPPCSRTASQDVAIVELPSRHGTQAVAIPTGGAAAVDLKDLIQNLPFSISPAGSPNPVAATTANTGRPASPVTIVNISVNHYNYQLQHDGTWAPQRTASTPQPTRTASIIVEMPADSQQLSRIPSRPMTPPGFPPTRIPSCPAPARTSSLGGSLPPVTFVPTPAPPTRLTSAPKTLAITNGSS